MDLLTTIPEWAVTDEAKAFALGFGAVGLVMVVRYALEWFKAIGTERWD